MFQIQPKTVKNLIKKKNPLMGLILVELVVLVQEENLLSKYMGANGLVNYV